MSIAAVSGPTAANCSSFDWKVNFTLPSASPAGGYFIQEITVARHATDCHGHAAAGSSLSHHYWEAWHVARGGTQDELVANGTYNFADEFSLDDVGASTKGNFSFTGSVRFYEGLTLPSSFVANNPATIAGALPSTARRPSLSGGTPAVAHTISGTWDCCPSAAATSITRHNP